MVSSKLVVYKSGYLRNDFFQNIQQKDYNWFNT